MLDKYIGCIFGGAIGDALGASVELLSAKEIFDKYGDFGIISYELDDGVAKISDDTQMTLFTANGLLSAETNRVLNNKDVNYLDYIYNAYLDWYLTQCDENFNKEHNSWILSNEDLFSKRHPGYTCTDTLKNKQRGSMFNPINKSKGSGGIMRCAPIGLFKFKDDIDNDIIGAESSALTHGNPFGFIPSAALVRLLNIIVNNNDISLLDAALDTREAMLMKFKKFSELKYFINLMDWAIELSRTDNNDLKCIQKLGEGWFAEETFAIGLYCVLKYCNDFVKGITVSVNHGGDSDSTGAVAGNILGAYNGFNLIPMKYIDNLEFNDLLMEISKDLYAESNEVNYIDYKWKKKYLENNYKL